MTSSLLAPTPVDHERVAALCARALALRHRDPAAARDLAERAVTSAESAAADSADDASTACDALRRRVRATLGACLGVIAPEVLRGREILEDVLAKCQTAGDDGLRCEVLNELAASHTTTYELDPALRYAREAAELSRRTGQRGEEVRAGRLAGVGLTRVGDFGGALTTLLGALALHEALAPGAAGELDDPQRWERGELFSAIAVVYSNMDQFGQALDYYRVALDGYGDRFPASTARTLYRMGIAAEEMDDFEAAERHYGGALEAYQAVGDEAGAGLGCIGMAKVLLHRGAVDGAEAVARRAISALSDPVHLGYYSDAVWTMGDVHLARGRPAQALVCYHEARALFDRASRPSAHRERLHLRFSRVYAAMRRWREAFAEHQRHHELRERQLEEQAQTRMAALRVQFDTERAMKDAEIHRLRAIELEREIAVRKEAEAALARAREELEERNRELHALTIRDPLTGAFNRRYLDQRLAEAMPLAARGLQPLSVMICDLDDFKRINDTCSHAVGDAVLREVAAILRQHVRGSDVVARFGGEEFVVLFPATTVEQAVAASEKVCALVREHPWAELHPGLRVTISAGVATAAGHATHEALLADADRRLYEAKARGKDCVVG